MYEKGGESSHGSPEETSKGFPLFLRGKGRKLLVFVDDFICSGDTRAYVLNTIQKRYKFPEDTDVVTVWSGASGGTGNFFPDGVPPEHMEWGKLGTFRGFFE